MLNKLNNNKNKIFNYIKKIFLEYRQIVLNYSINNKEFFNKYEKFILNGKCLRGNLVLISNKVFTGKNINENDLLNLAAFFEIVHSSLLIHDDIMDNDNKRRGEETINYFFYKKYHQKHLSNSLAISIGNIGFFIGYKLLSKIKTDLKTKNQLIEFISNEYIKVALAQNDDITFSNTDMEPNFNNIYNIYLFKTSRYTFVLPLISVLILKKNKLYNNNDLIKILELLGIIFQITDDLIGFLSDESGKEKGSDIRENKKTFIRYYLIDELKNNNLKYLFGKKNLNDKDIMLIKNFYVKSKTKIFISQLIKKYKKEIINKINKNNFPKDFNKLIIELLDFLENRKK